MTDITTSDDNCVDGFRGEIEYPSGVFDDDSNTRHFVFENSQRVVNETTYSTERNDVVHEADSDLSECEDAYRATDDCTNASRRKRRKRVMLKDELLVLCCSWGECDFQNESIGKFVTHVTNHIRDVPVETNDEDGSESYRCMWESCCFSTSIIDDIKCHVNFHSYHTKLKCIGANLKSRTNLPNCVYNEGEVSLMLDSTSKYKCCWSDCAYESISIQNFFFHIAAHVNETQDYKCSWKGCSNTFPNMNKLRCHVRVHTKEKLVACPDCGALFASNTKFIDHCKRQLPVHMSGYECAHCFKLYSSERILRDHMRSHINVVKCVYCDMTCATKYTLAAHIRYRHLKLKPFSCQLCDYRCETKQDLNKHSHVHDSKFKLICDEGDCNFTCRSQDTFRMHILEEHEGVPSRVYECHECGKQFSRGVSLTYHLMARHNLHWPSGHKRFSYRPNEEGNYKLQQIRYESLEATEQMASNKSDISDDDTMESELLTRNKEPTDSGILITVNESDKNYVVGISTIETVDRIPDGGKVIAVADE